MSAALQTTSPKQGQLPRLAVTSGVQRTPCHATRTPRDGAAARAERGGIATPAPRAAPSSLEKRVPHHAAPVFLSIAPPTLTSGRSLHPRPSRTSARCVRYNAILFLALSRLSIASPATCSVLPGTMTRSARKLVLARLRTRFAVFTLLLALSEAGAIPQVPRIDGLGKKNCFRFL